MNFTNPDPIKSDEKKVSVFGKIWASINLIALFGDFLMPKGAKDNIPIKVRNIIIIIFILLLGYFIGSGIYINAAWIIDQASHSSFSIGEWFYYFGFVVIIFSLLGFFNIENQLTSILNNKNIISSAMNDLSKNTYPLKVLNTIVKNHQSFTILFSIMGLLSNIWTIWGIVFYDRFLFITLMALSLLFTFIIVPFKNIFIIKQILIADIAVCVLMVVFILINHFYLS